MRSESLLVLVLTRRCDRRCGFCPQDFSGLDMDEDVLDAALDSLLALMPAPRRVKLFGGEPLLRPDMVRRVLSVLSRQTPPISVELTTHGGGVGLLKGVLAARPEVEVFVSRPVPAAADLPGAVHNFLLPPRETPAATVERFLRARAVGFRRFNFLPAYFTRWTDKELSLLRTRFAALRRALNGLAERGRPTEVVNLARWTSTPLCNDGLVVDTDGEVYASTLVMTTAARVHRGCLRLGSVWNPQDLRVRPACEASQILAEIFPPDIVASTLAADGLLMEFCRGLATAVA